MAFFWPYTEDFLDGIGEAAETDIENYLPLVDGVLTALIIGFAMAGGAKVRWTWALLGLVLSVGLGFWSASPQSNLLPDLILCVCYALAFASIALAVLGVRLRPGRRRRAKMTPEKVAEAAAEAKAGWRRFRIALPLVFGMWAAFFASTLWEHLFKPDKCIKNCDAEDAILWVWGHIGVHQEYFAQVSQIIPLLLIAVGVEARFFDQLRRGAIERTLILVTVITLCVGEALAVSAITAEKLHLWHEYAAFVVTVQAWSVALITLLWALARSDRSRT